MHAIKAKNFRAYLFSLVLALSSPALAGQASGQNSSPADSGYRQADSLALSGDTAAALTLLDRALALDPRHWLALILRGQIELAAGRLNEPRPSTAWQSLSTRSARRAGTE